MLPEQTPGSRQSKGFSYLVAQDGDTVRVVRDGPGLGSVGRVEESRSAVYRDGATTVTARECFVRLLDGAAAWVHADDLEVVES